MGLASTLYLLTWFVEKNVQFENGTDWMRPYICTAAVIKRDSPSSKYLRTSYLTWVRVTNQEIPTIWPVIEKYNITTSDVSTVQHTVAAHWTKDCHHQVIYLGYIWWNLSKCIWLCCSDYFKFQSIVVSLRRRKTQLRSKVLNNLDNRRTCQTIIQLGYHILSSYIQFLTQTWIEYHKFILAYIILWYQYSWWWLGFQDWYKCPLYKVKRMLEV